MAICKRSEQAAAHEAAHGAAEGAVAEFAQRARGDAFAHADGDAQEAPGQAAGEHRHDELAAGDRHEKVLKYSATIMPMPRRQPEDRPVGCQAGEADQRTSRIASTLTTK